MGLAPLELHGRRGGGKSWFPKSVRRKSFSLLWRIWSISFFQVIPMWVTIEKCTRLGGRGTWILVLDSVTNSLYDPGHIITLFGDSMWLVGPAFPEVSCLNYKHQPRHQNLHLNKAADLTSFSFPLISFLICSSCPRSLQKRQGPSSLLTWGHSRHLSHPWRYPTPLISVPSLREEDGGILTSRSQEKPASTDCRPLGWSHDLDLDSGWSVLAPSEVLKQFIHDGARQFGQAC